MDKARFKKIFDTHFDAVRSYVYYRCGDEELSTDIAQETFMKVWEKPDIYDLDNIKALLYKMAGDALVSIYRKKQSAGKYIESLSLEFNNHSPEDEYRLNELTETYEKALGDLPEEQRVTFLMSRVEELKYNEIAERLNVSVKAVEKRMQKALKYLRKTLQV